MKFDRHEFVEAASAHNMQVTFIKKDKSTRVMRCTLRPEIIEPTLVGGERKSDPRDVTPVFDLEAKGWRSFRNESVIDVQVVK